MEPQPPQTKTPQVGNHRRLALINAVPPLKIEPQPPATTEEGELALPSGRLKISVFGSLGQHYEIMLSALSEECLLLKKITASTRALNELRWDWPCPELVEAGVDREDVWKVHDEIFEYLSCIVPTVLVLRIRGTFLATPSWEKGKFQPASIRGPTVNLGDAVTVERAHVVGSTGVVKDTAGSWKWVSLPQQRREVIKQNANW